ncbi:MAG: phage portal protein [Oscillibacter ruminantium]|uniref:phage portal protein n=1 Tax=Oscillibacter ruminantium TaxID=1263547 RepID=UPI002B20CC76|nr:phage portal protein [Oscillibacter ruminantium]MEA5041368.1 phage portal protein [Oscillibacter ruminantium]
MNVFDRAIAAVSPERALKRAGARRKLEILNSGYSNYGASHTKKSLAGWLYGGGSSREDIEENLSTLRQRCRDLYMGVPLATGALKTCRTNVVGSGLKLKSQIDYEALGMPEEEARALESRIEREFALWADSPACDLERLDNFYELQQLAFLNWLMSGDVIATLPVTRRVNMPYDLRIHLIEADRLCNPNGAIDPHIIGGVETNEAGEVIAYHISKHHPLSYDMTETGWTRIEAWGEKTGRRNVIHVMNRERIGQRRGVPFLAPVIEALKQLGRYTDAELVAAVVSGMFTVFIEKADASSENAFGEIVPGEDQVDAGDDSTIELAPGAIVDLNEGEKAHDMNPGRPNTAFDGFVIAICRQIGAALEIPYELLVKNFNASYSASRGALLEAWKMFRMYRTWLSNDFCQPIYEEWFSEAVAKGRIPAPGFFADPIRRKAYTGAEWNGPAQGLLNPVQEVTAAEKRVENGFSTRDREAMEMNGSDFYRNAAQLKREEAVMREVKGNADSTGASPNPAEK